MRSMICLARRRFWSAWTGHSVNWSKLVPNLPLSASNITIGKAEIRRLLCATQSARCWAAYVYSAAGPGESTTDLAWDGQACIYELGSLLAETDRFPMQSQMVIADIDVDRLLLE